MNIVITGATGAIGSALAAILHARGDSLLLCGRDAAKLGSLNASLEGAHNTLVADLATADGLTLLQAKAADLGMMEGVAHCVGSTVVRPLHLTSEKDWHDQIATNATSAFHVLKWFVLQATKAQRPAVAVMTSSVVAEAGFANHEAIAAAKCAVTWPLAARAWPSRFQCATARSPKRWARSCSLADSCWWAWTSSVTA
jgi:NAD(P)-dependent dehydrogenase (short-subunit alcohol dehydrogenase family)